MVVPVRSMGMRGVRVTALVVAFGGWVGGCGGGGDEITADNVGDKLAQALCSAEDRCCQAQGTQSTSTDMLVCNGGAHALLYHLDTAVFSPAIAAACVKAAANYQCQFETDIEQLCRQVFHDPTDAGVGCAKDSDCPQPPGGYGACGAGGCISLLGGQGAVCSLAQTVYGCASYAGLSCFADNPLWGWRERAAHSPRRAAAVTSLRTAFSGPLATPPASASPGRTWVTPAMGASGAC
jgi:hypothetical protein